MKVFLVMEGFEYEGESVKKVFADLAKAEEFRLQCMLEDVKEYYTYTIEEHEVDV